MRSAPLRHKTLPGEPPVVLAMRRSARARRLTLRVSSLDGRVTLTVPPGVAEATAMRFVAEKREWIAAQLGRVVPAQVVGAGTVLPLAGVPHRVETGPGGDAVIGVRSGRPVGPQVRRFLVAAAAAHFSGAAARHAARLGRPHGRIVLRDTRSRWGSCSSEGTLMFNWRLILAPPEVSHYVAAHEVAHLAHMDHSRAFWDTVGELFQDHASARAWLKGQGATLHRWRFDD